MNRWMKKWMLSLSLVCLASLCWAAGKTVKEEETGRTFPVEIKGSKKGVTLTCTGTACREKTWVAVNVYAIAHWVDKSAAKSALKAYKGKSGSDIESNQKFFDALCQADIEKRLKLEFVRSVGAGKIRGAFKESLDKCYSSLPKVAKDFIALFKKDLADKDTIEIHSLPGGNITVYQNGKELGTFSKDKKFAAAVWKIWFQKELADDYLKAVKKGLVKDLKKLW